jgi:hypothetical protein
MLSFASGSRIWAELHERAFRRLGAATRIVVLDNLREGVLAPDIYYASPCIAMFWRTTAWLPCLAAFATRIEKKRWRPGVGHAKKTPLKGKRFESLEEAQAYLDHWEQRCGGLREDLFIRASG